jgi:hypothetical protein
MLFMWLEHWNSFSFFPVALQSLTDLGHLTNRMFLELFRHSRTPWTSDQPVARPLPTQDNTTQKDADRHPCLERDSNPRSQQPTGQDPRLRPHGHRDRHWNSYHIKYHDHFLPSPYELIIIPNHFVSFSKQCVMSVTGIELLHYLGKYSSCWLFY